MPLNSQDTINAFLAGYGTGTDWRKRQSEQELNRILGEAYDPGVTQAQVNAIPGTIRDPNMTVRAPGFNANVLSSLAKGGFGKEALALSQTQQKTQMESQAALMDALLKGAQYQKTLATTINPIDLETKKSNLRKQETLDMLKAFGISMPSLPSAVPNMPNATPAAPNSAGFTKTINGKTYVKISPTAWAEWGAE